MFYCVSDFNFGLCLGGGIMSGKDEGERLHWYCLTYCGEIGGNMAYGSTYCGYKDNHITLSEVGRNRVEAGFNGSATLMSATYLGLMTTQEFSD